jgi:hypothetical protein
LLRIARFLRASQSSPENAKAFREIPTYPPPPKRFSMRFIACFIGQMNMIANVAISVHHHRPFE